MATLRDIKRRIGGVRKTQKITRAMKVVAATKLRRLEIELERSCNYFSKTRNFIVEILSNTHGLKHPLLSPKENVKNLGIIVISSDRGLCGPFNANLIKQVSVLMDGESGNKDISLFLLGSKIVKYFRKKNANVVYAKEDIEKSSKDEIIETLSRAVIDAYLEGRIDRFLAVSNEYKRKLCFSSGSEQLLPLVFPEKHEKKDSEFINEPSTGSVLDFLLRNFIKNEIKRFILESRSSEETARMMTMEQATDNADDIIEDLTLVYNKTRQAVITKELIDIVGGAEAMA